MAGGSEIFSLLGLPSEHRRSVGHSLLGRYKPGLDSIVWSLKYLWELPPTTPHLSQPHRPAQWWRGRYVSSQVYDYFTPLCRVQNRPKTFIKVPAGYSQNPIIPVFLAYPCKNGNSKSGTVLMKMCTTVNVLIFSAFTTNLHVQLLKVKFEPIAFTQARASAG